MKIITICGSLKFKQEILEMGEYLQLQGNCVLLPIFPTRNYSNEDVLAMGQMHKEKIKLSDAIFVVNVGGYIGNSTQSEIEFAEKLGKEIIYFNEPNQ